jgi:ATP-dependent Zn protease
MDAYERAKDLLRGNLTVLHKMAEVLLEREVLDGTEIDDIIKRFGNGHATVSEPQTAAEAVS